MHRTMSNFLPADSTGVFLLLLLLVIVFSSLVFVWRRRRKPRTLSQVLDEIAFERIENLILPNADEGEIQIDHLVLTAQGLLVIHVKDVEGAVFGSDKMQDWTVISEDRRFTFSNPQPGLYDRIAAVRQVVRQVPVEGRIVFLDGAEFRKGTPEQVCGLDELVADFGESDKVAAKVKIEAFMPHWEQLQVKGDFSLNQRRA